MNNLVSKQSYELLQALVCQYPFSQKVFFCKAKITFWRIS